MLRYFRRAPPLAWAVSPVKGGVIWPGELQREHRPLLVMYSMHLKPNGSLDQLFPLDVSAESSCAKPGMKENCPASSY